MHKFIKITIQCAASLLLLLTVLWIIDYKGYVLNTKSYMFFLLLYAPFKGIGYFLDNKFPSASKLNKISKGESKQHWEEE